MLYCVPWPLDGAVGYEIPHQSIMLVKSFLKWHTQICGGGGNEQTFYIMKILRLEFWKFQWQGTQCCSRVAPHTQNTFCMNAIIILLIVNVLSIV